MSRLRLAFIAHVLSLSALKTVAHAACTLNAVAVLPIRIAQGVFVFETDINGKPADLIFDTGYFETSLTKPGAERLGVSLHRTDRDVYGVGGSRHNFVGTVDRMRFGGVNADGTIVGGSEISAHALSPAPWDGIFGMNMMAAYDIDLDVAGSHVVMYEADGACGRPTVSLQRELYSVKLEPIRNDRQAIVMIDIGGHMFKALLDSGVARSMMYRSAANRLDIDLAPLRAPGHAIHYGLGPIPVAVMPHVFKSIKLGDLQVNNMSIDILDQENNGIDRVHLGSRLSDAVYDQANGEQILIGADFMQKFHLWISHSSQMLIMQYPPQPSVLPH